MPATCEGKLRWLYNQELFCAIILFYAHFKNIIWMEYIVYAFIWITVLVTIISGIIYVFSARKTLLAAWNGNWLTVSQIRTYIVCKTVWIASLKIDVIIIPHKNLSHIKRNQVANLRCPGLSKPFRDIALFVLTIEKKLVEFWSICVLKYLLAYWRNTHILLS